MEKIIKDTIHANGIAPSVSSAAVTDAGGGEFK